MWHRGAVPFENADLTAELDFAAFVAECANPTGDIPTPYASEVDRGIPIYDGDKLRSLATEPDSRRAVQAEITAVIGDGAGVLAIRNGWPDRSNLDAMTEVFLEILAAEREAGVGAFDHYAEIGANSRAWDVLGKSAKRAPETYVGYYGNPVLQLVCEAWLGPWYQITAQVNIVHPGGAAQSPHRDYHLGFLSNDDAARFPSHVHRLSQALTLQGAVVHTAMPVQAGPTMVLPGSQRFLAGYLAWRDQRFIDHFATHQVQLPYEPGDAIFFNPGIHHAAGTNRTQNHDRVGNLLQVSSAFGVAMEAIDWPGISKATYPELRRLASNDTLSDAHIAACASGYPFPTNLDTDAASGGLAPPSAQDLVRQALDEDWSDQAFESALKKMMGRRRPS